MQLKAPIQSLDTFTISTIEKINTAEICIEPLDEQHVDSVQVYASDERVAATGTLPHPYPPDGAETMIKYEIEERSAGRRYAFAISYQGECIGVCTLCWVVLDQGTAEINYWLGVPFWGNGIATEAVRQALEFARDDLGLKTINSGVLVSNDPSRRVLEKNGFIEVETIINNGEYSDKFMLEEIMVMKLNLQ